MEWRLIDREPAAAGPDNMALDHVLFESVQAGARPALRFYDWDPPCLSFGRNQPAAALFDHARAQRTGIDVVRRPTGGLAVLHDRELTYSVAVPVGVLGPPRRTYVAVNRALVAGLRRLGVDAEVTGAGAPWAGPPTGAPHTNRPAAAPVDPGSGTGGVTTLPASAARVQAWTPVRAPLGAGGGTCFRAAAPGEVVAGGRKLVGSAQRCERRIILQHGSLLLDGDQCLVAELVPGPPGPPPATLREVLGRIPSWTALVDALRAGFEETLGIRFAPAGLSDDERARARTLAEHYRSPAWTWRR